MSRILYSYAFVPADAPEPAEGLAGLDGAPVERISLGTFACVVSRLPEAEYAAEVLEARMKDLEWVTRRGLEHERVVTWHADRMTVVPCRFLTVYVSEEGLHAEASERREAIETALSRLEGVREWDLKVSYELEALGRHLGEVAEDVRALDVQIERSNPGRRYLLERRRDALVRRLAPGRARELAGELLEVLREVAEDVRVLDAPPDGRDLPVVLNAAALVPSAAEGAATSRIAEIADRLRERGMRVTYSGPWAPYRFTGEDQDD